MRVYISGPMTGRKDYNFPAFHEAEKALKNKGLTPLNPARNPPGLEYHHYMDLAMAMVRCSQAILLLPGWEESRGAQAELAYARSIGLEVMAEI